MTISNAILRVAEGEDMYNLIPAAITIANDIYSGASWWQDGTSRLMIAKGTYVSGEDGLVVLPEQPGLYGGTFEPSGGYIITNQTNYLTVSLSFKSDSGIVGSNFFSMDFMPQVNGISSVIGVQFSDEPWFNFEGMTIEYLTFYGTPHTYNLPALATTNQVNTRLPKLSIYDTNTSATVTAIIQSVFTNGYNRLFLIQE